MKKYLILIIPFLFLLSGCATTPIPISAAKQAPGDRVLAFNTYSSDKTSTLTVIRDEGSLGSGCYLALYINKVLAARLGAGEFARFYLEPGEVLLRVGLDPQGKGLCALGFDRWTQRETFLKPGEKKTFRMSWKVDGELDIQRSDL